MNRALENYDGTLTDLALVQQNIVREQTRLGKIKTEIRDVTDELFETQQSLVEADEEFQEQAVSLYINGVMSPATALFIELEELSSFLVALGYASTIVDSAYEIVEQLNALRNLATNQTIFLTEREEERTQIVETSKMKKKEKTKSLLMLKSLLMRLSKKEMQWKEKSCG